MTRLVWLTWFVFLVSLSAVAQNDTVVFSVPGGFYEDVFQLELYNYYPQNHIRYTTNGSTPSAHSTLYEQTLWLDEQLHSTSDIFTVPVCAGYVPFVPEAVNHAIVIRAAAFDSDGQRLSDVYTQTYLIRTLGNDHSSLPVVSLCCDSLSLFDNDTGIMVPGVFFNPDSPETTGNYLQRGREWERLANVEFYENDNRGINQLCGLRMHGNRARKAAV